MTAASDRQILGVARLWAVSRQPYLASALCALQLVARPDIGTIAVDHRWRLYFDPEVVSRLDAQELGRVMTHLVSHLLRDHARRAGCSPAQWWLLAADAEVNDDLAPGELVPASAPDEPVLLGCPTGQLAERYSAVLADREPSCRPTRTGWLDCGSGADGCDRPWDAPNGMSARECRLIRLGAAQQVQRAARRLPGTVPGGWLKWAEQVLDPEVDWRQVLRTEIRRAIASVSGAVDYTYRKPSRRASVSPDVVLPSLHRPLPEIAVVCDTSGSMDADLLGRALSEIDGLITAQGLRRQLRVLAVDTHVHAVSKVTSARRVTLSGGGGTDMGAGIEAAVALRPAPHVIVVLTDGYTPWPAAAPSAKVIVGLFDQHHAGREWAPPAWARTVHIAVRS